MPRSNPGNNEAFSSDNELRRELEGKIDKKCDITIFWGIIIIVAGAVGTGYFWLMNMNERVTRVETKIEYLPRPSSSSQDPFQAEAK